MTKKISDKLTRIRDCFQVLWKDYQEARWLIEGYSIDSPSHINLKFYLEKSLLLREFVENVNKEELPEIIPVEGARKGVSLPVNVAGKMVVDMGVSAREAEYYLPRVHMTYRPWRPFGYNPSPEYSPVNPEFIGVEKLLEEKPIGLYVIEPLSKEQFERWRKNPQVTYRAFDPKKVDIIIKTLKDHFANSPIQQKLEKIEQKIQEAENQRKTETEETERKYYPLLKQRISNLIDLLIDHIPRYRVIKCIEYGKYDLDVSKDKEGRRKFFLLREKKLIFAPYKFLLGFKFPIPDLKKATDLPDRQWLRFAGLLQFELLEPYLSEEQMDFITTSEPWRYLSK